MKVMLPGEGNRPAAGVVTRDHSRDEGCWRLRQSISLALASQCPGLVADAIACHASLVASARSSNKPSLDVFCLTAPREQLSHGDDRGA
jgi:hypothetical protein